MGVGAGGDALQDGVLDGGGSVGGHEAVALAHEHAGAVTRSVSRRHGQHGVYYVAHSAPTPHEREVDAALGGFFNLIFLLMVVFQFCIMLWRTRSPKTYTAVTLGGLWLFPLGFAEYFHLWTFLSTWGVFSGVAGVLLYLAAQRPLAPSTPRRVYSWFLGVHKLSVWLGSIAGCLIFLDFFGVQVPQAGTAKGLKLWPLGVIGMVILFYALYYGVLGRDLAEVCADRMVNTMGAVTKGGRREQGQCATGADGTRRSTLQAGVRADLRFTSNDVCSICNCALPHPAAAATAALPSAAAVAATPGMPPLPPRPGHVDRLVTLPGCKHQFHEFCLRGWMIVGKKDTCPYCNEKCDMRALKLSPWDNHSHTWMQLLDATRYLVVWNPIILVFTLLLLKGTGFEPLLEESQKLHKEHAHRDAALLKQVIAEAAADSALHASADAAAHLIATPAPPS